MLPHKLTHQTWVQKSTQKLARWAIALGGTSVSLLILNPHASAARVLGFTLTNNSPSTIVEVWVSEDGYSYTQIRQSPIEPGDLVQVNWQPPPQLNSASCQWYVQLVDADKTQTHPLAFDMCRNPDLFLDNTGLLGSFVPY